MIYERYVATGVNNIEYGYTFKARGGDEDALFDLPIETLPNGRYDTAEMERKFYAFEKYAKAIVEAGPP